jgi:putative hemolysin
VLLTTCILFLVILYTIVSLLPLAIVRSNKRLIDSEEDKQKSWVSSLAVGIITRPERHILLSQIFLFLIAACVGALLSNLNLGFAAASWEKFVIIFSILVLTLFFTMIGSQIARSISYTYPEIVLSIVAIPLAMLQRTFSLFLIGVQRTSRSLLNMFGLKQASERDFTLGSEDFSYLVETSTLAGKLEEDEGELIRGVVRFSDTLVEEIMTPRQDVISIDHRATVKEAVENFIEHGFSRLLVVGDDLDEVHGVLIAKDLISLVGKDCSNILITDYIREAHSVSGRKKLDNLLEQFQKNAHHFAVVLDEHGGVDGIITMEDIVEEIFGDIFDEHDSPEEEQEMTQISSREFVVDGGALVEDINFEYDIEIPEGHYDTIAGFILSKLEEIPNPGAKINYGNLEIEVLERELNRVTKVRILVL